MLKFYGYKNCDTCRRAEKSLIKANIDYQFIDITLSPPSVSELKSVLKSTKVEIKKLLNTSGVLYREMNMKEKLPKLSESDLISLLSKHGKLVKRPLVVDKGRATIGFKEADFMKTWDS